jgi:hypothetical protein
MKSIVWTNSKEAFGPITRLCQEVNSSCIAQGGR